MPDSNGINFRTNINNALQALATYFYGTVDPATMTPSCAYPFLIWADTGHNVVNQRNLTNTAWVQIGTIVNGAFLINGGGATIFINSVTTGAAGSQASVVNIGTPTNALFDIIIPQGIPGIQGPPGDTTQQLFIANGIFTVPAGIYTVWFSGSAGGAGGSAIWGLGGGAGECCLKFPVSVTPGQQIPVTVGIGGTGSVAYSGNTSFSNITFPSSGTYSGIYCGTSGGNTSFGTFKILTGGNSPIINSSYAMPGLAGGPSATFGSLSTMNGMSSFSVYYRVGGKGGSNIFGPGGYGGFYAGSGNPGNTTSGTSGIGLGTGGGGAGEQYNGTTYNTTAAGSGNNGFAFVEYYAA